MGARRVCRAVDVCRLVNLLTQLEMQRAPGPLASLGGHFSMEDHTVHTNTRCPPPTPSTGLRDSAEREWTGGREGGGREAGGRASL